MLLCLAQHSQACLYSLGQSSLWCLTQGLIGVTLSAGVPTLHEGLHGINSHSFFLGSLYIVALGTGGTHSSGLPARTFCLHDGMHYLTCLLLLGDYSGCWCPCAGIKPCVSSFGAGRPTLNAVSVECDTPSLAPLGIAWLKS